VFQWSNGQESSSRFGDTIVYTRMPGQRSQICGSNQKKDSGVAFQVTDLKPSCRPDLKPSTLIPLQRRHHCKDATVCLSNGSDNSALSISVAFREILSTTLELLLSPLVSHTRSQRIAYFLNANRKVLFYT